jgi:hypothetical protein
MGANIRKHSIKNGVYFCNPVATLLKEWEKMVNRREVEILGHDALGA